MTGGRGSLHAEVVFTDCRVPADHVIGTPGRGFATGMRCLDAGRVIWSAYSVGAAEHLMDLALAHVTTRRQFGRPLADNQGLQWQIAEMAADVHAARLVALDAAVRYDAEPPRRAEAGAMAKLIAGEMAFRVADRADLARPPRDPQPRRHLRDPQDHCRPPHARDGAPIRPETAE